MTSTGSKVAARAPGTRHPATQAPSRGSMAAPVRQLRLAMPWTGDVVGFGSSALRLVHRIETVSAGRFAIACEVTDRTGIEAIACDAADLYHGTEHFHLQHHEALAYFAGLPYFCGLECHDLEAWLGFAGGQALWDEVAGGLGVKALLAGHTGRAPGLWSTHRIDTLADLLTGPIYVMGLSGSVLAAIGGRQARAMPNDLRPRLEQGKIIAVEWGGARASAALGLPQVAPVHMGFGFNTAGSALSLGIRRGLWDELGADERALIEACASEELKLTLAEARAAEASVRAELAWTSGAVFESMPGSVMTALSRASDDIVASLGRASELTRRVTDSYMTFRQTVTGLQAPLQPVRVA